MPKKLIVFRVDASREIGTGHVMRCLCLAKQLHNNGVVVSFICRLHDGHLCDFIEDEGFQVHCLPVGNVLGIGEPSLVHSSWL